MVLNASNVQIAFVLGCLHVLFVCVRCAWIYIVIKDRERFSNTLHHSFANHFVAYGLVYANISLSCCMILVVAMN
jgi:hypothetical protein